MPFLDRLFGQRRADTLIADGNRAETEGRLAEACELYRQAVQRAPRYAKAQLNLGAALEAVGDTAGAVACYEKALVIEPGSPAGNYNPGKLLYAPGSPPPAD